MSPGTNTTPTSKHPSLSPKALRPVLSQNFLANTFIERNDEYWSDEFDSPDHYWAYCREQRQWHRAHSLGGHMDTCAWECDLQDVPFIDFAPVVFFELVGLLNPLLETASVVDQRRCGSYSFLQGCMKILQTHPSIVITREDLKSPPRPLREEQEQFRREQEYERLYGNQRR